MKRTRIIKILVCVDTESPRSSITIVGGDLTIIDTDKQRGNSKLIILDGTQLGKHKKQFEQIAVFRKWAYWKIMESDQIEEEAKSVEELIKDDKKTSEDQKLLNGEGIREAPTESTESTEPEPPTP